MPLCPDCYAEGLLNIMINVGEERYKGEQWIILECVIGCGGSTRVRKAT
jgi:hypothetical protein